MKSKNLKGALFSDSDASILRKGTITIDGELKYVSLIKAKASGIKPSRTSSICSTCL